MLYVDRLSMQYTRHGKPKRLFQNLSFELAPSERLAVLGRNGQGKSTLIKILGGVLLPTAGTTRWTMRPSWPLGFNGGFQGGLTGMDNVRFLARIYDRPEAAMIDRVERFAELGEALTIPVKHYSSGMRARLAFGLSLAIEFDCYLIDEIVAVGDALFREKCRDELFGARKDRAFIIASHDMHFIQTTCTRGLVIENGRTALFDDVDSAIAHYDAVCAAPASYQ